MSAKHTPGPWIAKAGIGRWNVTTSAAPRSFNICSINTDREEQEANARLIAAAPDLLEALKLTRMSRGWQYMSPETREIIDAALYKSEGK